MNTNKWSIFITGVFLFINLNTNAESTQAEGKEALIGLWQGIVVREGSAQAFNFNLSLEGDHIVGEYDIPDWGLYRESLKEISFKYPEFSARFMYGTFTFEVNSQVQEMTGGNSAWNPPLTAHLKKSHHQSKITIQDITWQNKTIQLKGQLVEPTRTAADTLVIIVPGSGAQGIASWSYRSYADFFAMNNYAAIVYDKRGVGGSSGDHHAVGFDVFADDVGALLSKLKKDHPRYKKIGLFGISQGGWISTIAASHYPDELDFVIMSVGPAVSVRQQEMQAVEYQMKANDFSNEDIKSALAYTEQMFDVAYSENGWIELKTVIDDIKTEKWAEFVSLAESQDDLVGWQLQKYDPTEDLKNSSVPMLSILGDHDVLVPSQENAELMKSYIETVDKPKNKVVVIKHVGHNMSYQRHLVNNKWEWPNSYWHWGRKAPEYYAEILTWLDQLDL